MSEQPVKKNHDDFDPLAEARRRASVGRQIYEKFMDDGNDELSVAERVQGHQDMADYLRSRPSKDVNDRLHDPKNGAFMSGQKAGETYTPASSEFEKGEEVDEYETMPLSKLAELSAEALYYGDKTTNSSVMDAIEARVLGMNLSNEFTDKEGNKRDKTESQIYYDRIIKLRDKKLAELQGKSEGSQESEDKPSEKTLDEEIGDAVNRVLDIDPKDETPEKTDEETPSTPSTEVDTPPTDETPPENTPEETPKPPETDPSYEIPSVTMEAVKSSRDNFARLSAARRGETLGKSSEELAEAKRNYEAAIKQANEEIMQQLVEGGLSAEEAKNTILVSSLQENRLLMTEIAKNRVELSNNKGLAKFYQWFGRQKGLSGRLKKMAATATITAPLGFAAGIAGVALAGPITGALLAGAMARGVAKSLASGRIEKEASSISLAEQESIEDINEASAAIHRWMEENPGTTPPADLVSEIAQNTTKKRLSENRRRTVKMMTIGATVGAVSGYAANWLIDAQPIEWLKDFFGGSSGTSTENLGPIGESGPEVSTGNVFDIAPNPPSATVVDAFLPADSIPTGSFNYPWSWAESTFGGNNATPMLETLVERAKEAGLDVEWNPNPGGVRYIEANGASDAQSVINVLKQFVKPGEIPSK